MVNEHRACRQTYYSSRQTYIQCQTYSTNYYNRRSHLNSIYITAQKAVIWSKEEHRISIWFKEEISGLLYTSIVCQQMIALQ